MIALIPAFPLLLTSICIGHSGTLAQPCVSVNAICTRNNNCCEGICDFTVEPKICKAQIGIFHYSSMYDTETSPMHWDDTDARPESAATTREWQYVESERPPVPTVTPGEFVRFTPFAVIPAPSQPPILPALVSEASQINWDDTDTSPEFAASIVEQHITRERQHVQSERPPTPTVAPGEFVRFSPFVEIPAPSQPPVMPALATEAHLELMKNPQMMKETSISPTINPRLSLASFHTPTSLPSDTLSLEPGSFPSEGQSIDSSTRLEPSSSPTVARCVLCTDTESLEMERVGGICSSSILIDTKCNKDDFWSIYKFCQASCFAAGNGYPGYNCCTSAESRFTAPFAISVPQNTVSPTTSLESSYIVLDMPSSLPTGMPSSLPSDTPSSVPSLLPSGEPSSFLSNTPTTIPSAISSSLLSSTPSSVPSLFPSSITAYPGFPPRPIIDSCVRCTDRATLHMLRTDAKCADASLNINRRCNKDMFWSYNKLCQASCFAAGNGYSGDNCCIIPEPEAASIAIKLASSTRSPITHADPVHNFECVDSDTWYFINKRGDAEYCNYFFSTNWNSRQRNLKNELPHSTCNRKGNGSDHRSARDACPAACGYCTSIPESNDFYEDGDAPKHERGPDHIDYVRQYND